MDIAILQTHLARNLSLWPSNKHRRRRGGGAERLELAMESEREEGVDKHWSNLLEIVRDFC